MSDVTPVPPETSPAPKKRNWRLIGIVAGACLLLMCVCLGALANRGGQIQARQTATAEAIALANAPTAEPTPTAAPTSEPTATAAPEPTATLAPTDTPAPTDTAGPTNTPAPTATPEPQSQEDILLAVVKEAFGPAVRGGSGLPEGEWKVEVRNLGEGPEAYVTMPLNQGLSNEQFLRQAKRTVARVMNAVFVADPSIVRTVVVGTFPLGDTDQPAVSMFAKRSASNAWGRLLWEDLEPIAEHVDIKPRFQE